MDENNQKEPNSTNSEQEQYGQSYGYGKPNTGPMPNVGYTYRNPYTGAPQNWQRQNPVNRPPVSNEEKAFSALSYFGILWLVGLLADRENQNVMFHVNQGIILSVFEFALIFSIGIIKAIIEAIFGFMFVGIRLFTLMGIMISGLLSFAGGCVVVAYIIIGVVHALQGRREPLPLIGKLFTVVH